MPINYKKDYPKNWHEFSKRIRFERAGNHCEQCGIENYSINERGSKVVLTVAHLDHTGGICDCKVRTGIKCAIDDHVLALCQKCHLRLDHPKHIEHRRVNLMRKRDSERSLFESI